MLHNLENLYQDITKTWKFIKNNSTIPQNDAEWDKLIAEAREVENNDDKSLAFHLVIGYMTYLRKQAYEK